MSTTALQTLVSQMASRFEIPNANSTEIINVLKHTCFKQSSENVTVSDGQLFALMVVANQYGLNPWTREIYAYPDKKNGIVPIVGVDGWSRIINQHEQLDGIEFNYSDKKVLMPGTEVEAHEWIECVLTRKDRSKPIVIREFLDECYKGPFKGKDKFTKEEYSVNGPWQTHPNRFLRHKALIQCSRVAFGFTGIYDQDEGERIVGGTVIDNDTGNVTGETLVKPQRAKPKATDVQDVAAKEQPANKEQASADQPTDQAQATDAPTETNVVEMPKPGQLKWIEQKCASLGLDVSETLGAHGIESLEKMTLPEWETVKKDLMKQ